MMTEMDDLDDLFALASAQAGLPSPALMSRIVQDADRLQMCPAPPVPRKGPLATLTDWFGGGFSLAGMSVAALTGLYLGMVQPAPFVALANLVTGPATIDGLEVLPATTTLWAQE